MLKLYVTKILYKMRIPVQEKKKYVIKLHKEEYTVRQISERLRISSRDVIQIIKK